MTALRPVSRIIINKVLPSSLGNDRETGRPHLSDQYPDMDHPALAGREELAHA